MKTLTIVFVALLLCAVAWGLGYRTGALDEGIRNRAAIKRARADVKSYEDAFQELSDKLVSCQQSN
jgi:hypothetical protein